MMLEHAGTNDIVSAVKTLLTDTLPKLGYHPLDDVQILTPMHHGVLGTDNLNAELQALLNPNGAALTRGEGVLRVGDKVMQLKNNYDLDVFNGDVGRVEEIGEGGRELFVRYDGRTVRYSAHELDQLVLAYACTIHKSQGSEYPCVIVPVHPDQRIMLQKNLLYTAVTRGKKTVALVGASEAIDMAVQNSRAASRHTRLRERLQSAERRASAPEAPST
jgi:exodeoxyribonuclease V alpha subunit